MALSLAYVATCLMPVQEFCIYSVWQHAATPGSYYPAPPAPQIGWSKHPLISQAHSDVNICFCFWICWHRHNPCRFSTVKFSITLICNTKQKASRVFYDRVQTKQPKSDCQLSKTTFVNDLRTLVDGQKINFQLLWSINKSFIITQAKMSNIVWFRTHKCEGLLLLFAIYDSEGRVFGFGLLFESKKPFEAILTIDKSVDNKKEPLVAPRS